MKGKSKN